MYTLMYRGREIEISSTIQFVASVMIESPQKRLKNYDSVIQTAVTSSPHHSDPETILSNFSLAFKLSDSSPNVKD